MKMAGAQPDEIGIIQPGRGDADAVRRDGIFHPERQQPFHDGPMPACRRYVVDTRPGNQQHDKAEPHNGEDGCAGNSKHAPARCHVRGARSVRIAEQRP